VDTFITVSKASSKRAIDLPASYVGSLTDGDEIFVESYGRKFVWDTTFPSGTSTVDGESFRPTVWTGNGAFIADLNGNPKYWRQAAWFVSTAGDDENDGLTSSTPVKTDIEIRRRWGSGAGLSVPVTITYAQAPTTETNFEIAIYAGGSLTFLGTPVVTNAAVTLTTVNAQVRTAGAEVPWSIVGATFGAADLGKLVVIASSSNGGNVGAYAKVVKQTGTTLRVSPFGKFVISDGSSFTQVTPLVGDVVNVVAPTDLQVGQIMLHGRYQGATQTAPTRQCVIFDSVKLNGNASSHTCAVNSNGVNVFFARSDLNNITLTGTKTPGTFFRSAGGGIGNVTLSFTFMQLRQSGVTGALTVDYGGRLTALVDTYFQGSALSALGGAFVNTQGAAFFDSTFDGGAIAVLAGGTHIQTGATADWGTNNTGHGVKVFAGGQYIYTTKPTINSGLGAGREAMVGATDKLWSEIPYVEATNNAALVLNA
jgi:hypothetical protein